MTTGRVEPSTQPRMRVGPTIRGMAIAPVRRVVPGHRPAGRRRARARGSPPPTATEYLDFTAGIAVASTGHCHPQVVDGDPASRRREFIHAQVNCYRHDLLEPLADAPRRDHARRHRHASSSPTPAPRPPRRAVKLAKQATGRPNIDRVQRQLPRSHPPDDGDDDVEDRLPRRARAAAVGRVRRAVPRSARRRTRTPRSTGALDGLRSPAQVADRARRDGGDDHRARARRGRLHPRAGRASSRASSSICRAARHPVRRRRGADRLRAHRARCSRSSTTASSPTSSAWRRASRRASRSPRSGTPSELIGALAEGQPRRHLRRQPHRLRGRARHHRGADRARASSTTSTRAASSCSRACGSSQRRRPGIVHVRGLGLMIGTEFDDPRASPPCRRTALAKGT